MLIQDIERIIKFSFDKVGVRHDQMLPTLDEIVLPYVTLVFQIVLVLFIYFLFYLQTNKWLFDQYVNIVKYKVSNKLNKRYEIQKVMTSK